jgi:hypothetical protein
MRNKVALVVIALVVLSGLAYSVPDVPHDLQVKLMLKILCVDRNFTRFGDPIKIGVTSDEFLAVLNGLRGKMEVKGKDFLPEKMLSLNDISKYKVIYVGENWSGQYKEAAERAIVNQSLMFCEVEAGVLAGGAVSFKVVETKPRIVVDINNARKQGTEFPASFLKITVLVGGL